MSARHHAAGAVLGAALALAAAARAGAQPSTARDTARDTARALRVLPVVGAAPETGVQLGGTLVRIYRTGRPGADGADAGAALRPSTDQLFAVATQRRQVRLFVERDAWFAANRRRLNLRLEALRFPQPFFGLGADAPAAAEEWYTANTAIGFATLQQSHPWLGRHGYLTATYRITHTDVVERERDGRLVRGDGPATPRTAPWVRGASGSRVGQLELGAIWDTRDNIFAPRDGRFVQLAVAEAARPFGSEFRFSRLTLDARRYRALGARTVLAGQLFTDLVAGRVPFDQLPQVGGATVLRGYVRGRWRDQALSAAQLELRQELPRRFGVVGWAGVGGVAPSLLDLGPDEFVPTFGVGVRWMLLPGERANLRVDVAQGRGSRGLYVGFAESF